VRASIACLALLTAASSAFAQVQRPEPDWSLLERPRTNTPKPTAAAITVEDLRTRLFIFSDDSMRGRELGDRGNVMGTNYIAAEAKRIGLEPAGENGTYFQTVPVVERGLDESKPMMIGGTAYVPWKDYLPRDNGSGQRSIEGVPVVYGGVWGGDRAKLLPRAEAAGKVVLVGTRPDDNSSGIPGLPNRQQVTAYFESAAGILIIGMENVGPQIVAVYRQPTGGMREENPTPLASYIYITREMARASLGADPSTLTAGAVGKPFAGNPVWRETPIANPGRNVVGILRGSDPTLRGQYVAIGAHNDHIGMTSEPVAHDSIYVVNHLFRLQGADDGEPKLTTADAERVNALLAQIRKKTNGASARLDSVYNGADDDGTGSVSVLELAEYFAAQKVKPKRSLLFIWHVGEEEGLFGSQYFTDHPTVPRDSIVAELNMDMEGRGDASDITGVTKAGQKIQGSSNYLQLIGSRRLSTELGDMVEKVNTEKKHNMQLDYSLDADGHPQNIYCRSDHYEYARYGIPIVFFTTGGHADYHQLTDEPQYIDYAHMQRVVTFVRDIAVEVADAAHRPVVDKPKPDPKGQCQQ
jgi:hypothetical protein